MRRISAVFAAAALLFGSFVVASAASGASSKSPLEVLRLSVSAMHTEGSFHYMSTSTIAGSVVVSVSTNSSLTTGDEVQKLAGSVESTRLIGKSLYIDADAKAYADLFGVKKTTLADKWVLVPTSNKNYANLSSAILVPSVMQQLVDIGDLKEVGTGTVNSQAVVELRGNAGASGDETIYVSTAAPFLPVAVSSVVSEDGEKMTNELVFSKWGEKFAVAKPSSYVVATKTTLP